MITYINKENAQAYQQLFLKAEKVLKEEHPADLGILDWDNFKIGSLNEYFAYLEALTHLESLNEEQQKAFIRLPLDEDVFEINADTRVITVPRTFSQYGIGVQGDEMAEVVYFTIDRFFDSMDLAADSMNIAIQWEARNADRQVIAGFSKNFGKEIIQTVDKNGNNKSKIVFGWPISSELTQTNGAIRFAVRFYSTETVDNVSKFTYSFTTLPAEVNINATLDYDLLNGSLKEIDHGDVLLRRIKSAGIYDENAEIPEAPTITVQLYAPNNADDRIIDLTESGVELAIAAQPTTFGTINYVWGKYGYNEANGDYANMTSPLAADDIVDKQYLEVTTNIAVNDTSYFYNEDNELVNLAETLEETDGYYEYEEELGFKKANVNTYIKLYKEYSVATVHSVGKYEVTVQARSGANTKSTTSQTITIPGPLKPEVQYEETANISDGDVHIIASDNGTAILTVDAVTGESSKTPEEVGSNPDVTLEYSWYKKGSSIDTQIANAAVAGDMTVSIIPAANVFANGPEDLREKSQYNQNHIGLIQEGNMITTYKTAELEAFESTSPSQAGADHEWVALDIDTKTNDITTLTWKGYPLTQDDVDEAASIGLAAGHIIFWMKMDAAPAEPIAIGDVELAFIVKEEAPTELVYSVENDGRTLSIQGLPATELDNRYYAKVTARRNNVSTAQNSLDYHITNMPEKPIIKVREYNATLNRFELVEKDYTNSELIEATRNSTLSFSVEPPAQSVEISYIWMRVRADETVESDWIPDATQGSKAKAQIDLDDAIEGLVAIIGNPAGAADYPLEADVIENARKYLTALQPIGNPVDENFVDNVPSYTVKETDAVGYYYCVVINKLNGHINANASPFFHVVR